MLRRSNRRMRNVDEKVNREENNILNPKRNETTLLANDTELAKRC